MPVRRGRILGALLAITAIAVLAFAPAAMANHCPGNEIAGTGGTIVIDGVTLSVVWDDANDPTATVTNLGPGRFVGTISVKASTGTASFPLDLDEGESVEVGPVDPNDLHGVSHVCLSGQSVPGTETETETGETETTETETQITETEPVTETEPETGLTETTETTETPAPPGDTAAAETEDGDVLAFTGFPALLVALGGAGLAGLGFAVRRRMTGDL